MIRAVRRSLMAAALAVPWTAVAAAAVAAQEVGSPARGLAVTQRLCADCHMIAPGGPISPRFDAPPFALIANTSGMNAMALSAALQTSHRTMPNVVLEPADFSDVIAYVMSLQAQK